jgi:hypothetical protein
MVGRAAILFFMLTLLVRADHIERMFPVYTAENPGLIVSKEDFLANRLEIQAYLRANVGKDDFWTPPNDQVTRAELAVQQVVDKGTKDSSPFYRFAALPTGVSPKAIESSREFELAQVQSLYARYFRQFVGLILNGRKFIFYNFVQPEDLDNMKEYPAPAFVSSANARTERLHFIRALYDVETGRCSEMSLVGEYVMPPGAFSEVRTSQFTGYILPADYVRDHLSFLLNWEHADSWNPSDEDVEKAYARAHQAISDAQWHPGSVIWINPIWGTGDRAAAVNAFKESGAADSISRDFGSYAVQFIGLVREGKRIIYCNFVRHDQPDLSSRLITGAPDSGASTWHIEYDVQSKKCFNYGDCGRA